MRPGKRSSYQLLKAICQILNIFGLMSEYRLSELNTFIRRFVALNLPEPVWVEAELAEVDERRGHYYLSLIEKDSDSDQAVARAQAVMWDRQARKWQRQQQWQ